MQRHFLWCVLIDDRALLAVVDEGLNVTGRPGWLMLAKVKTEQMGNLKPEPKLLKDLLHIPWLLFWFVQNRSFLYKLTLAFFTLPFCIVF